jgi:hypothetical protein
MLYPLSYRGTCLARHVSVAGRAGQLVALVKEKIKRSPHQGDLFRVGVRNLIRLLDGVP